jgi:hypothetical protein
VIIPELIAYKHSYWVKSVPTYGKVNDPTFMGASRGIEVPLFIPSEELKDPGIIVVVTNPVPFTSLYEFVLVYSNKNDNYENQGILQTCYPHEEGHLCRWRGFWFLFICYGFFGE